MSQKCQILEPIWPGWWVIFFVLGMLLIVMLQQLGTMTQYVLDKTPDWCRRLLFSNGQTPQANALIMTPFLCICLNVLVYFIWGLYTWSECVSIPQVVIYVVLFDLTVHTVCARFWPNYFPSSAPRCVSNIVASIGAFIVGRQLQARARRQGTSSTYIGF